MKRVLFVFLNACHGAPPPATQATPVRTPQTTAAAVAPVEEVAPLMIDPQKPTPRLVLHAGDSFVGGSGGLTVALRARFTDRGAKFVADWFTSVHIEGYARDSRFADLIKKYNPDLIILTLGANDMYAPVPWSLAPFIRSIAKKAIGRDCYWITPVMWETKARPTGIIDVIKANAAPCKVFDGTGLYLERAYDHIHPSNLGGRQWADAFFERYDHPEK